jgi:hypothetical protein
VLGRAQAGNEYHLVILACRGNVLQSNVATKTLVGADDDSYNTELQEEASRFTALDQAGREAAWAGSTRPFSRRRKLYSTAEPATADALWAGQAPQYLADAPVHSRPGSTR